MTLRALSVQRDYGDSNIAVLTSLVTGIDQTVADTDTYSLPAGFGDCKVLHIKVVRSSITGPISTTEDQSGVGCINLEGGAGSAVDAWDSRPWVKTSAVRMEADLERDMEMLYRQTDTLQIAAGLIAAGAGTYTRNVIIVVQRLRNVGA